MWQFACPLRSGKNPEIKPMLATKLWLQSLCCIYIVYFLFYMYIRGQWTFAAMCSAINLAPYWHFAFPSQVWPKSEIKLCVACVVFINQRPSTCCMFHVNRLKSIVISPHNALLAIHHVRPWNKSARREVTPIRCCNWWNLIRLWLAIHIHPCFQRFDGQ